MKRSAITFIIIFTAWASVFAQYTGIDIFVQLLDQAFCSAFVARGFDARVVRQNIVIFAPSVKGFRERRFMSHIPVNDPLGHIAALDD